MKIKEIIEQLDDIVELDFKFGDTERQIQALKNTVKVLNIRLSNLEKNTTQYFGMDGSRVEKEWLTRPQRLRSKYPNHGKPWKSEEEKLLRYRYHDFIRSCSKHHGRSIMAIQCQFKKMDINNDYIDGDD